LECLIRTYPAAHGPPNSMNRIARLAAFALLLLLMFLAALAVTQHWLKGHTERVLRETITTKQTQFDQLLAISRAGPPPWDDATLKSFSTLLGATLTVSPASGDTSATKVAGAGRAATQWEFTREFAAEGARAAQRVRVKFTPPAIVHLISLYQETALLLLFLALGLLLVFLVAVVLSLRSRSLAQIDAAEGFPSMAQSEINSLTHLAKVSVRQSSELERERIERQRAEEDAHFQQTLLNRALEEKIRLGHDLHDGIIQSLYAAGLTVEAAKNLIEQNPAEAKRQLEGGVNAINTTIREVRGYIAGLSPESMRHQSFADSIRSLTQTLDASRAATYDLRIDETASALLSEEQTMHLLQISREAISNGLRHGGATQITVRLHQSAGDLCLLVQDNGSGFNPTTASGGGHGLTNMRARTDRLGAQMQFWSSPGAGTKLIVTLVVSPSPAT
jgi:signal transduction histidine kinase